MFVASRDTERQKADASHPQAHHDFHLIGRGEFPLAASLDPYAICPPVVDESALTDSERKALQSAHAESVARMSTYAKSRVRSGQIWSGRATLQMSTDEVPELSNSRAASNIAEVARSSLTTNNNVKAAPLAIISQSVSSRPASLSVDAQRISASASIRQSVRHNQGVVGSAMRSSRLPQNSRRAVDLTGSAMQSGRRQATPIVPSSENHSRMVRIAGAPAKVVVPLQMRSSPPIAYQQDVRHCNQLAHRRDADALEERLLRERALRILARPRPAKATVERNPLRSSPPRTLAEPQNHVESLSKPPTISASKLAGDTSKFHSPILRQYI